MSFRKPKASHQPADGCMLGKWVAGAIFSLFATASVLTPLFYLSIKPNEFAVGFLPMRMINADLKHLVVFLSFSLIVAIVLVSLHLGGKAKRLPPKFLFFFFVFLSSILVSTLFSHNPMRAWVSALQWHVVPLFLALSLSQMVWTRRRLVLALGLMLLGGFASCLVALDQHYQWTDWSHRLVRANPMIPAGIIYNHNFAAEYHAPLIPLVLVVFFSIKSLLGRAFCLVALTVVFLPALALSMARGAWVGLIMGSLAAPLLFCISVKVLKSNSKILTLTRKRILFIPLSLLLLAFSLPVYVISSDFWKKGGFGIEKIVSLKEIFVFDEPTDEPEPEVLEQKIPEKSKSDSYSPPVFSQSKEAKELKSIVEVKDSSVNRRFVLWKDAFNESLGSDFLFGKGTDHYELFYHQSAVNADRNWGKTLVRYVHNDYVQILFENGILGLVGWMGMWGFVVVRTLGRSAVLFAENRRRDLAVFLGLLACVLCFLTEAVFEFPSRSPCAMMIGWSAMGILLGLNLGKTEEKEMVILSRKPKLNLLVGATGLVLPFYVFFLSNNLFWANLYHFQGRAAADAKKPERSLHFHRLSISHAPWQHASRKAEGYLLITHEKRYLDAMKSIEDTLSRHPGCLQAHQNRIALLINEFKNLQAAKLAFVDMKRAAPYHPFTLKEEKKIRRLLSSNGNKSS